MIAAIDTKTDMEKDFCNVTSDINLSCVAMVESSKYNKVIKIEDKNRKTPIPKSILYNTLRL